MEDLYGRDGEKGTYEIADPSVNVEEGTDSSAGFREATESIG